MAKKIHISMINLWCNKNLVDSQLFLWKLLSEDWDKIEYFSDPYDPEVQLVLLNTCWFISSGREEMFQTIEQLLHAQKKICLIGCAVQYFEKILKNVKKQDDCIDAELLHWEDVLKNDSISYLSRNDLSTANLENLIKWKSSQTFDDFCRYSAPRMLTNYEKHYEYLKIAEWCNNSCAFCIIPKIRWKLTSLPINTVIEEAENLLKQWIQELIIIAQDTMRYGTDFSSSSQLLPLLSKLDKLPYDFKYRVLYLYPDILTQKHLEEFSKLEKFIPYFDIPLQHISPKLLKSMWRFYDDKMIYSLLDTIRKLFPQSFVRTNIIIWFPWETESDMELLQDFLSKDYFDNIALFEYHDEPLAPSFSFSDKVEDDIIHKRFEVIRKQVDSLLAKREKNRKSKNQIGFVEDIFQKWKEYYLSVRPELHCPEIDFIDEIKLSSVVECLSWDEIGVGSKILYLA